MPSLSQFTPILIHCRSGRHVIHAYTAGNEPYDIWAPFKDLKDKPSRDAGPSEGMSESMKESMKEKKKQYEALKEERAACLWEAVQKEIPDIKMRALVSLVRS